MSRTDQEQKVDSSAREWVCIREHAHIWIARRNQESDLYYTGFVCMAISSRCQANRCPSPYTILFLVHIAHDIASEPIHWSPFAFHPSLWFADKMHITSDPRPTVTVTCRRFSRKGTVVSMIHDLTEDKQYNTIKLPLRGAHKESYLIAPKRP